MKIAGSEIRKGYVIEYNNRLCYVLQADHRTPGNLRAFMQIEMKEVLSGTKHNVRFSSTEMVERVNLEEAQYQFLYADGDTYNFMHQETFEQIVLNADAIGDQKAFLQDGMIVSIQMHETTPIGVKLPSSVILEVVEADPVVKGQTAAASYKPAVLSNGVKISVPPFVTVGQKVVVNTETGEYVERAKD